MAERPDERWTNEGMGDRGGAARYRREPNRREDERWPDEGFGDRGGAARRRVIEGEADRKEEPGERSGFWSSRPSDYEGGYGGGRQRAEELNGQSFGETGWGGGRGSNSPPREGWRGSPHYPEGARPVRDSPDWDERYVRENADKYGQWGGQAIVQRGAAQSRGGYEHKEQSVGDTRDLSPRGGHGIRETERWDENRPNHAGKGPKNYQRSDERIADDVCQRLTDHPGVDATNIEIAVKDGEVTLTGIVSERRARYEAEEVAANTPGVRDVQNQLRLG